MVVMVLIKMLAEVEVHLLSVVMLQGQQQVVEVLEPHQVFLGLL